MHHGRIGQNIAKGLRALRQRIDAHEIPPSALDQTFNLATWNVREFGKRARKKHSLHLIAEILHSFDLIAITEVRDNLSDLAKVLDLLGPYWRAVYSDYNIDPGGNRERIAYVYDTRMIEFTGLAAEVDPPRKKVKGEYLPTIVGEGLSEAVGAGTSVTIPFAVEPSIMVTSSTQYSGQEMKLTRIVRGVLEVESFYQSTTTYDVRAPSKDKAYEVLIRHPQAGPNYSLAKRPEGTEDLEGAWLVPVPIPAKGKSASMSIVEQTPSTLTLTIWDSNAVDLLVTFLSGTNLPADARTKLQPVIDLRREIGKIDTEVDGLRRQQYELQERSDQTRLNLDAIKKDPKAGDLRAKLNKRLDEFSSDADALGRKIVELESKRLEKQIELEDLLQDIDLRAPATPGPTK